MPIPKNFAEHALLDFVPHCRLSGEGCFWRTADSFVCCIAGCQPACRGPPNRFQPSRMLRSSWGVCGRCASLAEFSNTKTRNRSRAVVAERPHDGSLHFNALSLPTSFKPPNKTFFDGLPPPRDDATFIAGAQNSRQRLGLRQPPGALEGRAASESTHDLSARRANRIGYIIRIVGKFSQKMWVMTKFQCQVSRERRPSPRSDD